MKALELRAPGRLRPALARTEPMTDATPKSGRLFIGDRRHARFDAIEQLRKRRSTQPSIASLPEARTGSREYPSQPNPHAERVFQKRILFLGARGVQRRQSQSGRSIELSMNPFFDHARFGHDKLVAVEYLDLHVERTSLFGKEVLELARLLQPLHDSQRFADLLRLLRGDQERHAVVRRKPVRR